MKMKKQSVNDKRFLANYFSKFREGLLEVNVSNELIKLKELMIDCQVNGQKTIIVGNGGSAAIASHCSIDFNKTAGIRCLNFNESSLITCLANDYGYEAWVEKAIEFHAKPGDLIILISSSGTSQNMIRAADYALSQDLTVVTFSGFSRNNPLKRRGHLNFWVNSKAYNFIELFHQFWLLAVCDLLVEIRQARGKPFSKKSPSLQAVASTVSTAA